ncbi:MAG: sulfatase-like hydrolase/transferase [Anaerolineales bacterium]
MSTTRIDEVILNNTLLPEKEGQIMAPPNVIYVLSDEHSGFAMSHMGDPNVCTPHMDRLASEGVSFRTAYANTPICTPSRGTIFSGRHAHAGPVQNFFDVYKPSSPSTATLLRSAGYHTAYFGKWHMGVIRDQISPAVRRNPDLYPEPDYFRRTPEHHRGGFQDWFAFELNDEYFNFNYYHAHEIDPRHEVGYQTDLLTEHLLTYLGEYNRAEPLFAVLSLEAPHFPLEVPEAYLRFDPTTLITRPNFVEDTSRLAIDPGGCVSYSMRERLARYYAMLENLDWNLGRLLDGLKHMARFRTNTLIVYFSDHGEYMGSHGLFERKEHPHQEAVRIPVIFHLPGRIPSQGLRGSLFSLVDLLPTTLGLLNLPIPTYVQGQDFSPACLGQEFAGPDSVLLEMNSNPRWALDFVDWRGLVTEHWKYVFYETGHELLFDLQADPYEMENLAQKDPTECAHMRSWLLRVLEETREPYFHILIEHGVKPDGPVINVSNRWRDGISPAWKDLIGNIGE